MELIERRRALMAAQPRLPWGYQEVEWVETKLGAQWIATGIIQSANNIVMSIDFSYVNDERTGLPLNFIGCANNGRFFNPIRYATDKGQYQTQFGAGGSEKNVRSGFDTARHKAKIDLIKLQTTFDDIVVNLNQYNLAVNQEIWIGRLNGSTSYANVRIYGSMISLSDDRVREFIPCYRKVDSKPGMYDLAGSICPLTNSPFYINAGTSEFLVGPDVN